VDEGKGGVPGFYKFQENECKGRKKKNPTGDTGRRNTTGLKKERDFGTMGNPGGTSPGGNKRTISAGFPTKKVRRTKKPPQSALEGGEHTQPLRGERGSASSLPEKRPAQPKKKKKFGNSGKGEKKGEDCCDSGRGEGGVSIGTAGKKGEGGVIRETQKTVTRRKVARGGEGKNQHR